MRVEGPHGNARDLWDALMKAMRLEHFSRHEWSPGMVSREMMLISMSLTMIVQANS